MDAGASEKYSWDETERWVTAQFGSSDFSPALGTPKEFGKVECRSLSKET